MPKWIEYLKANKTKLYALALILIGAVGGNVDRVDSFVKTILYVLTPTAVVVEQAPV
jgi:lipoprotein signal peptidase